MSWKECGSACPKTCDTLNEPQFCIQALDFISFQVICNAYASRFNDPIYSVDFLDFLLTILKRNRLKFLKFKLEKSCVLISNPV